MVDWFAPGFKAGGPIRSSLNVAIALKDNFSVKVLTTDTDHGEEAPYAEITPNTWTQKIDENISVYYGRKKALTRKQLRQEIQSVDADFIYLNHIWSPYFVLYPIWLKITGQVQGKMIVCPRGGLFESALSVKRYKKSPLLLLMKWLKVSRHVTFHATNEREKEAIEKFFPKSNVLIADNLPNTLQPEFVAVEKVPGELKCVFIARVVAIKNLLFLLNCLQQVKANVQLTIIGPAEDEGYWNDCKTKMGELPANISAEYIGSLPNDKLLAFLQKNHLFVLPTTGENFGHSIFESLQAGRPVLISDQTPWRDLATKKIGWDLPLDQPKKFVEAIEVAAAWNQDEFDNTAHTSWHFAKEYISDSSSKKQYLELFS